MTTMDWFPWLLSAVSCLMLWLMGNKSRWGPLVGLACQVLWLVYTLGTKQYGFLPGVAAYTMIHTRNLWRWTRPVR